MPAPVPYANLANPQTLNLYAMVSDNPETFADLDGHCGTNNNPGASNATQSCNNAGSSTPPPPGNGPNTGDGTSQSPSQAAAQASVQVNAAVIQQPKIVQGEKQADGTSVTGVRGTIQDTITVNGKPLSGVAISETNTKTVTLNGKEQSVNTKEGSGSTNNAGQVNDVVGLLAPARTAAQDSVLINLLKTQAVTVANTNTITFTVPGGSKYLATATRTLTNVASNGEVSSNYTLRTTQPVVRVVPQ